MYFTALDTTIVSCNSSHTSALQNHHISLKQTFLTQVVTDQRVKLPAISPASFFAHQPVGGCNVGAEKASSPSVPA